MREIFHHEFILFPKQVPIDKRIAAKARLWDFINDIKYHLLDWPDSEEELATNIITFVIDILTPHFTFLEVERELRNIYTTLKRPVPKGFITILCSCYERRALTKINSSSNSNKSK